MQQTPRKKQPADHDLDEASQQESLQLSSIKKSVKLLTAKVSGMPVVQRRTQETIEQPSFFRTHLFVLGQKKPQAASNRNPSEPQASILELHKPFKGRKLEYLRSIDCCPPDRPSRPIYRLETDWRLPQRFGSPRQMLFGDRKTLWPSPEPVQPRRPPASGRLKPSPKSIRKPVSELQTRFSLETGDPKTRSVSLSAFILNLFNNLVVSISYPRYKIRAFVGPGNNREKVVERLRSVAAIEVTHHIAAASLVWTQLPSKRPRSSLLRCVSSITAAEAAACVERSAQPSELAALLAERRPECAGQPSLLASSFAAVVSVDAVNVVLSDNLVLANNIEGIDLIASKHSLALLLMDYLPKVGIQPFTVIPPTVCLLADACLSDPEDLLRRLEAIQPPPASSRVSGEPLQQPADESAFATPVIIKPGAAYNRGNGISIAYSRTELLGKLRRMFEEKKVASGVLQAYLTRPLLFKGRKFDLRCYALLVSHHHSLRAFWYRRGYARTSSLAYDPSDRHNMMVHLTNEAVQVKGTRCSPDQATFGQHEPGNKVYFDELEAHFGSLPETQSFSFRDKVIRKVKVGTAHSGNHDAGLPGSQRANLRAVQNLRLRAAGLRLHGRLRAQHMADRDQHKPVSLDALEETRRPHQQAAR